MPVPARARALVVSVLAAVGALALGMLIVWASGRSPLQAISALYDGAFQGRIQVAGTVSKLVPLVLVALGWIVAFRARRINIGFQGQILMGGLAAGLVGMVAGALPTPLHLAMAIAAAAAAGAAWAGVAAWLWARRGVNEIISTLLLSFVAVQFVAWLLPKLTSTSYALETRPVHVSAQWPALLPQTPLAWDIVLVPLLVVATQVLLTRTVFGLQLRFTGENDTAARSAGVDTVKVGVVALLISGGLAGVAGSSLILAGQDHSIAPGFDAGYGFDGIVVALLGGNSPLGAVPAAGLFAVFHQSAFLLEAQVSVPSQMVNIVEGFVVALIAASSAFIARRTASAAAPEKTEDDGTTVSSSVTAGSG
jgi:general nucleoside transport system permease protein